VNSSGSVTSTDVYNAYGKLLSGNPSGDEFGFGGQAGYRTDQETGLVLLGERYYDPQSERFLTRDPLGYAGGMDLYAYCGDNPVGNMDPSGLCDDGDPACVDLGGPNTPGFAMEHATLGDDHQAGLDFASAIVHAVPGVGTVFNGSDAVSGCDVISGRPVSTGGRWWAGAMAILSLIPGLGLESGAGKTVSLYRAVGVREFDAVMSSGVFRAGGNSLEGRQFAFTMEEALDYARTDVSKVAILKADIDASALPAFDFSRNIDPFIFRNGVVTVQPGLQSEVFQKALNSIEHVF
jgi:RHS repeat-associated protein